MISGEPKFVVIDSTTPVAIEYQGDGHPSMCLEEDDAQLSKNYKLRVWKLLEDEESPAPRSLKIFRLRTVPGEKMDATRE
jgi:hypothetical protein